MAYDNPELGRNVCHTVRLKALDRLIFRQMVGARA